MTLRAHLATFPARRALMLDVVDRIAPQVEVLHVCLNGYDTVPDTLARHANVRPTIPPRDLMDAGKFLPQVWTDDRILLIDDDIAYPPDYVTRTLKLADRVGLEDNAVGYQGLARTDRGLRPMLHDQRLGAVRGVGQLGTGTALILGRHLPPLRKVEAAKGWVDVRVASHLADANLRLWALPREAGWLPSLMTDDLRATSLAERVHRAQPYLWRAEQAATLRRFDHMGMRLRDFRLRAEATPQRRFRIVR